MRLCEEYKVSSVPTLLLFDDNYNLIDKHSGLMTVEQINNWLSK